MNDLIIGLPSKGRIQEHCEQFFKQAGLSISRDGGSRNYHGKLKELSNVEIMFLSSSEISKELAAGTINLGITGLDLVHENVSIHRQQIHSISPLGFGHANVVLAVPRAWIDVFTMEDLNDVASDYRAHHGHRMRVATKFLHITRNFFDVHGLTEYRIVESVGATEGAPAAGSAELIVDITSTGKTLLANDLKILEDGTILESQAHLFASLNSNWNSTTIKVAQQIFEFINASECAQPLEEFKFDSTLLKRQKG